MNELSLHVLDIAQNSIVAGATEISVSVLTDTEKDEMRIEITDNGCGMDAEMLKRVVSPFTTSRTTRKVGLGVPLLKMTAEMTGGSFDIGSTVGKGTQITAVYKISSVDCLPLGDMGDTMMLLVQQKPGIRFIYRRGLDGGEFTFDTEEAKALLEGVPLDDPEVLAFIQGFITENETEIAKGMK